MLPEIFTAALHRPGRCSHRKMVPFWGNCLIKFTQIGNSTWLCLRWLFAHFYHGKSPFFTTIWENLFSTTFIKSKSCCFFSSEMESLSGHTGDGTIRIWDVTDGRQQQIGHLKGHEGPVWKVQTVGRLRGRSSCLMRFVCLIRGHWPGESKLMQMYHVWGIYDFPLKRY